LVELPGFLANLISNMKIDFMKPSLMPSLFLPLLLLSAGACSSSSSPADPQPTGVEVVTVSGGPLTAAAGDVLALEVVQKLSDGTTRNLPAPAQVEWSGPPTVTATAPDGTPAANPYPAPGATPTAVFINNPSRPDVDGALDGVLFIQDPGTTAGGSISVTATVTGIDPAGAATVSVAITPAPTGDPTHGATLFGATGANCAACHGATGHGSPVNADGSSTLEGTSYPFPAPGLNAEDGNAGAEWSQELFATASRADLDDQAVSLRLPMPDWLVTPNPSTMALLSPQDFADIFAFLKTQTQ
jgi:mono/diheme cytochrome c family protein